MKNTYFSFPYRRTTCQKRPIKYIAVDPPCQTISINYFTFISLTAKKLGRQRGFSPKEHDKTHSSELIQGKWSLAIKKGPNKSGPPPIGVESKVLS
jgi:hypothetical protein